LEEVMMARTRIIQSYTQINFALSAAHQQICSCPAATASRRRGNDLRTTIKYLGNNERRRGHWPRRTRIIHRCTQVKFAIFRCTSAAFLCTQESWNPEVINTFFARARIGGSRDDAHPDSLKLHTGKIYSFPLHISKFVLLLLRQRRGAVAATSALRSSTCEKQRAAPRTSA
jgi:hypothetical protein